MPSCTVSPVFSSSSRSFGRASFATSMRRRTSAPSSNSATPRRYLPVSLFCSRNPAPVSVAASRCTVLFARRSRLASVVMPSSFSSPENEVSSRIEFATEDSRAFVACSMVKNALPCMRNGMLTLLLDEQAVPELVPALLLVEHRDGVDHGVGKAIQVGLDLRADRNTPHRVEKLLAFGRKHEVDEEKRRVRMRRVASERDTLRPSDHRLDRQPVDRRAAALQRLGVAVVDGERKSTRLNS